MIALACSIGAILMVTFTPEPGAENELQLVPFIHLGGSASETTTDVLGNIAGNTLLFVPSELHSASWAPDPHDDPSRRRRAAALVEAAQLLVPGRTTSVDDLCLNRLGGCWAIPGGRMAAISPAVGATNRILRSRFSRQAHSTIPERLERNDTRIGVLDRPRSSE